MISASTSALTPIGDADALREAVHALSDSAYLCIDTEFERNQTYFPRLCLIQIAMPGRVYLIDPLPGFDLSPLDRLLTAAGITKVFHSGRQDLELLLRTFGYLPHPLFDTQLAAAALGLGEQLGYGQLIHRLLNVELDKGHARTDWCARPLSDEQLQYAADDVRWLCPAFEALERNLEARGRLEWVIEDSARLGDPELYAPPTQDIWKKTRGLHTLRPRQLGVLQALAAWREEQAMASDLPRRWVLPDETLVALAAHGDPALVHKAPGMSARRLRRWGDDIRAVLRRSQSAAQPRPPTTGTTERLGPEQQAAIQAAMRALRARAKTLGVSPSYLASRGQVTRLILGEPVPELTSGWRARVLGTLPELGPRIQAATPAS